MNLKEMEMTVSTHIEHVVDDSPGVHLMPPAVFFSCLVIGAVLAFVFPQDLPLLAKPLRIVLGILIGAAGMIFMTVADARFKRSGTHVETNQPATVLVVQGAYQYSRNPMYTGGSAFFLGIGLAVGSLWMMAAYLPLGLYLALYVIPREEAYMERVFGEAYREYCGCVRRWL